MAFWKKQNLLSQLVDFKTLKIRFSIPINSQKVKNDPQKRLLGLVMGQFVSFYCVLKMGKNLGRETGLNPKPLDIAHDTLYSTPIVKRADFLDSRGKKWVKKYHFDAKK